MKEFYAKSYFTRSFALQSLCLSPPNPAEHAPTQPHLQAVNPELLRQNAAAFVSR